MIKLTNWQPKTKLEKDGLKITRLLKSRGFQAFWVGGLVRNILLKKESDNLDITTDARPEQVEKILKKSWITTKPIGKKFGTILAITKGYPVEITTFRAESRYSDCRHPDEVKFIKDYIKDAERRDFTINALYFDPIEKIIFDPTGGLTDLENKIIRFVGDPKKRIDEDPLRMLRASRLHGQLGFKIEKRSFAAIKTRAKLLTDVSGERIKMEFDKILLSKNRSDAIKLLDAAGLLKFIIPEFEALKKFSHQSKQYHLEGTMFDHTLLVLKAATILNLDLLYALLFHDIGKPEVGKKVLKNEGWVVSTKGHTDVSIDIFLRFTKKVHFSKSSRNNVVWLIKNHMLMKDFAIISSLKQIKYAAHPAFPLLLKHWEYDDRGTKRASRSDLFHKKYLKSVRLGRQMLELITTRLKHTKWFSGTTIMNQIKIPPGPTIGKIQKELKTEILLGKVKSMFQVKKFLKNTKKVLDKSKIIVYD